MVEKITDRSTYDLYLEQVQSAIKKGTAGTEEMTKTIFALQTYHKEHPEVHTTANHATSQTSTPVSTEATISQT